MTPCDDVTDEDILFAAETVEEKTVRTDGAWKILVVDDDDAVHQMTSLVLEGFRFNGHGLTFLNAHSYDVAEAILADHPDVAVILLDAVMPGRSGLELVRHVREVTENSIITIIIRTGQSGKIPDTKVMMDFDVNLFAHKTDLDLDRLEMAITSGLRAYVTARNLQIALRRAKDEIQRRTLVELRTKNMLDALGDELHDREMQLDTLFHGANEGILIARDGMVVYCNPSATTLFHANDSSTLVGKHLKEVLWADEEPFRTQRFRQLMDEASDGRSTSLVLPQLDGGQISTELFYSAMTLRDSELAQVVIRDVSDRVAAERALAKSEEKHRILFESSRDAIMTLAPPSWLFTSCNNATLDLFGVQETEEFAKLGPWHLSPKEQADGTPSSAKAQEFLLSAMETGSRFFEWTHCKLDGTPLETTVLLTRVDIGEEVFLQATVRDITDQKWNLRVLEQERVKFQVMFEMAPIGMLLMDEDTRVIQANASAISLFPTSPENLIGTCGGESMGCVHSHETSTGCGHGELCGSCPLRAGLESILAGNESIRNLDLQLSLEKGAIKLEPWVRISAEHFFFDGRPHVVVAMADVTQEKLAHAKIQKAHENTQRILDDIPVGIMVIDQHGVILGVNQMTCEALGLEDEESIVGTPHDRWLRLSGRAQEKLEETDIGYAKPTLLRVDGTEIPILRTVTPTVMDGEHVWLETLIDVTELERLEMDLEHARKLEAVGQLAAGIAHEINTPIQFVGDNVRFLKDAAAPLLDVADNYAILLEHLKNQDLLPALRKRGEEVLEAANVGFMREEIPQAVDQSLEGIKRVSKIVRAMKEFSHPGQTELAPANLNEAIRTTMTIAKNEWKYVSTVDTDLQEPLPLVPCLINEINQVLLNMIINARDAIAEKLRGSGDMGVITIATRQERGAVEIRVSDTGNGIPVETLPKIFDPFFTTKEVGKGSGQGLAISYNVIVKRHHGTLRAESEVGKGTTFIIGLPLGEDFHENSGREPEIPIMDEAPRSESTPEPQSNDDDWLDALF
ncbi:hypothetical protein BVX99_00915 [bacterium F16]|nr:hypothetical protein BVX99_00915 [bacterium F16]